MSDVAWAIKVNGCWAKYTGSGYVVDPNWVGRSESANRAFVVGELRKLRKSGYEATLVKVTRCGHKLPRKSLLSLERETGRILALNDVVVRELRERVEYWTRCGDEARAGEAKRCIDFVELLRPSSPRRSGDPTKESP